MGIQIQKLRAVIWPLLNPDTGFIACHTFRADSSGHFSREEIRNVLRGAAAIRRQVFLSFELPEAGNWEQEILALGETFGKEFRICGIEAAAGTEAPEEARHRVSVFREAFPAARLFVPPGTETGETKNIGFILQPNEILDNEYRAEKACLAVRADPDDAELVCFAAVHRVALLLCAEEGKANRPCHAGHRFRIREITMDDTEKDHGTVSFTVTVRNDGTVPCYEDASFMLRLCGSGIVDERVYPLGLKAADLLPGQEKTVRLEAEVKGLSAGEYDVQTGLFFTGTGDCCSFGIEGRISDGYYEGRMILEL